MGLFQEKKVFVFDIQRGELSEVKQLPVAECMALAYSPDGRCLVVIPEKSPLQMYDAEDHYTLKVY